MSTQVTSVKKKSGVLEPFLMGKLLKRLPRTIAEQVVIRLPPQTTTQFITETSIKVCLSKKTLAASRLAAGIAQEQAEKRMTRLLGLPRDHTFADVYHALQSNGKWKLPDAQMSEALEQLYTDLTDDCYEYWQLRQWEDKYSLKYYEQPVETIPVGVIGIALAIFDDHQEVVEFARAVAGGVINLPTPVLTGCRNGDFDSVSCCVVHGGDSVESIGAAQHIAYRMTAKKAGIGLRLDTRAKGEPVKGDRLQHFGKQPLYAAIEKDIKMFSQTSRGGSATVTFSVYDPDVLDLILLKSQRTPEGHRVDKIDYSMAYDDDFVQAVVDNQTIQLRSALGIRCEEVAAREILKTFLTTRQETGRLYCINLSAANRHTPFTDEIHLSNLCQEITLPTAPFTGVEELYHEHATGEVAFCSLAAINPGRVTWKDYPRIAYLTVKAVDNLLTQAPAMTPALRTTMQQRRSLGIGITGLAAYLADNDCTYTDHKIIEEIAERHYHACLSASIALVEQDGRDAVQEGIDPDWLPIDTKPTSTKPRLDWESLRGRPRRNSVLVAHMPTESSAQFSNATNGLYPARHPMVVKQSRHGGVPFHAPANIKEFAWDVPTADLIGMYGAVQAYTDQAISADYYIRPRDYPQGKVPLSVLMKEWVMQARAGLKTMYYVNTDDTVVAPLATGCDSGACSI